MRTLKRSFLVAASTAALISGISTTSSAQTLNDLPELNLPAAVQADAALAAIGNRLPLWASVYEQTVPAFAKMLRDDASAFLDPRGRLLFVEPLTAESPAANADMYGSAPYPLEQTFLLESRPGAPLTIYLDFDGEQLTNTAWNSSSGQSVINAIAWSQDADRTSFNDSEKRGIQLMWRSIAEDFAPFDVNVTTRYPGEEALVRANSSDPFFGTRVLFTQDTFYNCGCGGVAYVGVFDYLGSNFYQPALVFNSGLDGAAEAASHEAGHNLGLSHDGSSTAGYYAGHGSGETGWAPIMGVGYYKNLVQWSKGEYADASQTQDDFAVMNANLLPFVPDDHGNASDQATVPVATGDGVTSSFSIAGVIEQPADVDAFRFTAGEGPVWISATPVYTEPNLDIGLELIDGNGAVVATSNNPDTLSTTLEFTVPAGEYTLMIDGVGKGDPLGTGYTDYGSLGGYRIAAQFADGSGLTPPTAVIASDYTPNFAPLTVNVDASGSTDATSFVWDFGDGATAIGVTASHTYTAPGEYTLELIARSDNNLTAQATQIIDVVNQAPIAVGSVDITDGEIPLTVTVSSDGSSDPDGGAIVATWDFGDGSQVTNATAIHTYTAVGEFPITLTVTDDLGAEASSTVGSATTTAPRFVSTVTRGESSIAGSVFGSHLDTHVADDGNAERITERESGGKKNRRYSYLEHEWLLDLPAGESVVDIRGSQNSSPDGDVFSVSWATLTGSGVVGDLGTSLGWISSGPFIHPAGGLTLTLRDSNRDAGNLNLDTAVIDAIVVTTDTSVDSGTGDGTGGGSGGDGSGSTPSGLSLTLGDAYKVKGSNYVLLNWDAAGALVDVLRNDGLIETTTNNSLLDDQLGKGGMTLQYQICLAGSSDCSNVLTVAF